MTIRDAGLESLATLGKKFKPLPKKLHAPMDGAYRFKLLGQYSTPLFNYGEVVFCEWRGDVEIVGLTDAKIPWPVGKKGSNKSLVIYDDLALRRESNQPICFWWGITPQTVTRWRKALSVPLVNEGTRRLFFENAHAEPNAEALKRCHAKAREPENMERLRKLAESRRGQPRPKYVVEAVRVAFTGRKLSPEHRARISERNKQIGIVPPQAQGQLWTIEEDEAVQTLTAKEAAAKTGRTLIAVYRRRNTLGLPDARRR